MMLTLLLCCLFAAIVRRTAHDYVFLLRELDAVNLTMLPFRCFKSYRKVYALYWSRGYTTDKFQTRTRSYPYSPIKYKDAMIGKENPICNSKTFLLILVNVNSVNLGLRQYLRRHYKQGMEYSKKQVNYAFMVACDEKNTVLLQSLKEENEKYKDILISLHADTYNNISMTVFDGFYFVLEHCKRAAYICKTDGDSFVNFHFLINFLSTAPLKGFYSGFYINEVWKKKSLAKRRMYYVPDDYEGDRHYVFAQGGGFVFSNDLTPYVCIGAQFYPLNMYSDDPMVGKALEYAGYHVINANRHLKNCLFMAQGAPRKTGIKYNIIFIHYLKGIGHLSSAFDYYTVRSNETNANSCFYIP